MHLRAGACHPHFAQYCMAQRRERPEDSLSRLPLHTHPMCCCANRPHLPPNISRAFSSKELACIKWKIPSLLPSNVSMRPGCSGLLGPKFRVHHLHHLDHTHWSVPR